MYNLAVSFLLILLYTWEKFKYYSSSYIPSSDTHFIRLSLINNDNFLIFKWKFAFANFKKQEYTNFNITI